MHLSSKGEYALRALAYLQRRPDNGRLPTTAEICQSCRLPVKYVEQILTQLRHAGILESKRGQQGGWKLARSAADISVGETLRTVDGRFTPLPEILFKDSDDVLDLPSVRALWMEVRDSVRRVMDSAPITVLVGKRL